MSIISALIVDASGQRFAVPRMNLVEIIRVPAQEVFQRIELVCGDPALCLRDRLLPLVRLADALGMKRTFVGPADQETRRCRRDVADRRSPRDWREDEYDDDGTPDATKQYDRSGLDRRTNRQSDYNILVLQVAANQYGLVVDALYDTEEVVVNPPSSLTERCECFTGITILGDGHETMILDAGGLAHQAALRFSDIEAVERRRKEKQARQRPRG